MKIKIIKKLDEMSAMGGGAVGGYAQRLPEQEEDDKLDEMYSSSGGVGLAGGHGPHDRSAKGHKRYVRMRFINQKLQNFKPNRYFAEEKKKTKKIRIKKRKNLEEKCQKGYKTHEKRKTKKMFGKTYRNCVKAE